MDPLKRLDMKVDFAAVDPGTVIARIRQNNRPVEAASTCMFLALGRQCRPTSRFLRRQWAFEWLGEKSANRSRDCGVV